MISTAQSLAQNCNLEIYRSLGKEVFKESECFYVDNEIPNSLLNGVIAGAIDSKESVDKIIAYYRNKERPFSWIVETSREPEFLAKALKGHSLNIQGEFPGLSIDLKKIKAVNKPKELLLETVKDDDQMKMWSITVGKVFGLSEEASTAYSNLLKGGGYNGDFTHISGIKDGKVVVTGSVLCTAKGAFIYNIATVEEERRKGYAEAVCSALLETAKTKGHTQAALMSSPMATPLYCRLGFEEFCKFHVYA